MLSSSSSYQQPQVQQQNQQQYHHHHHHQSNQHQYLTQPHQQIRIQTGPLLDQSESESERLLQSVPETTTTHQIQSYQFDSQQQSSQLSQQYQSGQADFNSSSNLGSNMSPNTQKSDAQPQSIARQSQTNSKQLGTQIYAWGCDSHGQMGISNKKQNRAYIMPKIYSFNINLTSVSCGEEHAAIVADTGHVYQMGNNVDGRLGATQKEHRKIVNVPVLVQGLLSHKIIKISCGNGHTAAISDAGEVFSWGVNQFGALGIGRITAQTSNISTPTRIAYFAENGIRIIDVSCGTKHSGFVAEHGALYMTGSNQYGQLGLSARALPPNSKKVEAVPKHVASLAEKVIQVACGQTHTLILTDQNNIYSMGSNKHGQLGIGSKSSSTLPVKVPQFLQTSQIFKIAAGGHSGAVTFDGQIFIWGSGVFGQYLEPTSVAKNQGVFVDIQIGNNFGAAVHDDGSLWTWGSNSKGELGLGDTNSRLLPTKISNLRGRKAGQVSCGGSFSISISTPSELKIRRLMDGSGDLKGAMRKQLQDAVNDYESKILPNMSTTPKGLHSIVEDTKEESVDDSQMHLMQRQGFQSQKKMQNYSTSSPAQQRRAFATPTSTAARAQRESASNSKSAAHTIKKAINQAQKQIQQKLDTERSLSTNQSRSRSFNAPLQIQKRKKLSTKDLGPAKTNRSIVSTNSNASSRAGKKTQRITNNSINVVSLSHENSGGFPSHRRSTTSQIQQKPQESISFQIKASDPKSRQTKSSSISNYTTMNASYTKDRRSVSPNQPVTYYNISETASRSITPGGGQGHSRNIQTPRLTGEHIISTARGGTLQLHSRKQTLSQDSTIEPGIEATGSGFANLDAVYNEQILDRQRMRIKQLELKCQQLRLENFKLVQGPGGVLELKRMLTNKQQHFEEVEKSIREEKSELLQKLEQQTQLLNQLQDEVYRMRKDQENYQIRFQKLNQEKQRIQIAMQEQLSKHKKKNSDLQAEKLQIQNNLRKATQNHQNSKMKNQTKNYQQMRDMRDNFQTKINELLYNLDTSNVDRANKDRMYDEEHQLRLQIEDKMDKYKQLSERQVVQLDRLNTELENKKQIEIQINEQRSKRMRAEDSNDKLKQLSKRQSQQLDRLRQLLDRNAGQNQLVEIEREKRNKAQEQADRYRQLSERQITQIDRITSILEKQRQAKSREMQKMREQLQKSKTQTISKIEQVVRQKVRVTQENVRKEFQAERMKLGNQMRNIKLQNDNIVNRVSDSQEQVNKLRKEILDWQKRGDMYESTIMGLRVQINYLEQQNPNSNLTYRSPMRSARVVQSRSTFISSSSVMKSAQKQTYGRDVTPSPERRGQYGARDSASSNKNSGQAFHTHSHSAVITSQFTDKQRQKMLESYSRNLLKSIEKKASAQSHGGIDDRFKHLASNPVFTRFSSKFLKKSTYHSSGAYTPKPEGKKSSLNLFEKLSTPQKQRRNSGGRITNLLQSGGSGSISKIQHPRPNTFQQQISSSSAFELGDRDSGTVNTGRFGRSNNVWKSKTIKYQNDDDEGENEFEQNKYVAEEVDAQDADSQQYKVTTIIKMDESADFPQNLKQQDSENDDDDGSDFEIVKNKLVHIGDTSRLLGRKADVAAEDIQSHRRAYQSNKKQQRMHVVDYDVDDDNEQILLDRPPSVGDAQPSKDANVEQ